MYSLGVLLYELLVGSPPFESKRLREAGWAEMLRIIQEEEPARPSARVTTQTKAGTDVAGRRSTEAGRLARELRGDLDWIALKALEKDRSRRYQSAQGLAEDVRRHLVDEPVMAGPPTLGYRLGKAARRHKAAFAAGGVVAVALVGGTFVSTAFYLRAEAVRRERQREVVRLHVKTSMQLADEGDPMGALPGLVEALRLEEDPAKREIHRYRIGMTLANAPALVRGPGAARRQGGDLAPRRAGHRDRDARWRGPRLERRDGRAPLPAVARRFSSQRSLFQPGRHTAPGGRPPHHPRTVCGMSRQADWSRICLAETKYHGLRSVRIGDTSRRPETMGRPR